MAHLPILVVLLPLIGAPVCFLVHRPVLSRALAIGIAWALLACAGALLSRVLTAGHVSYAVGGFEPPFGIELRVDSASAYLVLLVSAIAAVVFPFGPGSARTRVPAGREPVFYTALLLALAGLVGMSVSGDAFNVYVFLEISSLASYTLVSLGHGRRALTAAFAYLVLGTIGGVFFLLGVGLIYQLTGTLNMLDMAERLQALSSSRTTVLALGLVTVGIGVKLAVYPLHQWLPNAYAFAPSMVSAFLAATGTKVMFYALARMLFTIFGVTLAFQTLHADALLIPLGIVGMFAGSIAAIYQDNLKRLLAYSSVAQVGYMTFGMGLASVMGLTGALVHVFNHALMKGGLFLVCGCITMRIESSEIKDMCGLGRRMPFTMAAFIAGGLALIGVPATVGFVSKWYLVQAAFERGGVGLAALILLSSLLAVVYVWRVIEVAYFQKPTSEERCEAPLSMLLPTWILIGASIYFGLHTELTVGVASSAAHQLLGIGP